MKQFTCIEKDGQKWLREVNPYMKFCGFHPIVYTDQRWKDFEQSLTPILFPEGIAGKVYDESEVELIWQYRGMGFIGPNWFDTRSDLDHVARKDTLRQIYRLKVKSDMVSRDKVIEILERYATNKNTLINEINNL